MKKEDLLFILNTATNLSGHQANGPIALSGAQRAIKAYIADKEELQDSEILIALDRLLKVSSAAQVPGLYIVPAFNLADYIDPKQEETIEETVEEPVATTPDDAPVQEPVVTEEESLTPVVQPEEAKE